MAGSALKDRDTNQIDVDLWMAQMLVPAIAPDDPFSALDNRLLGDQISGEILVDNLSTGVHKANVSVIIWRVGLENAIFIADLRNQSKSKELPVLCVLLRLLRVCRTERCSIVWRLLGRSAEPVDWSIFSGRTSFLKIFFYFCEN